MYSGGYRVKRLTVFHMECACTRRSGSIMCASWAAARLPPRGRSRASPPSLLVPRFAIDVSSLTRRLLRLEKKMEKGRRHTQKYFIAAGVSVREGKNSDARLTFSALLRPEDGQANLCIGPARVPTSCLNEEFAYAERYFSTQRVTQITGLR